jgi:RNA polymerase sigma factor for flagellar operon FliA
VVRVEDHLPLVGAIARALSRGLPSTVEFDELINDGVLGLIDAARRYDPTRGAAFSTYAGYRIRGAILDGLRARDPLPRRVRRARKRGVGASGCARAACAIQLLQLDDALAIPEDEAVGPEALAIEADLLLLAWKGLTALPPRDRQVVTLRLICGLTLREVAARLRLSITRIAEIQTRGLKRLRAYVEGAPARTFCRGRTVWQDRSTGITNHERTVPRSSVAPPLLLPAGGE